MVPDRQVLVPHAVLLFDNMTHMIFLYCNMPQIHLNLTKNVVLYFYISYIIITIFWQLFFHINIKQMSFKIKLSRGSNYSKTHISIAVIVSLVYIMSSYFYSAGECPRNSDIPAKH